MMHPDLALWKVAALGIGGALALTGCNTANDADGTGDAPVGKTDPSPVQVLNMPDGFPNVATKCIAFQPGKRVYVTSHGQNDVQPVIIDDPACGTPASAQSPTTENVGGTVPR